MPRKPPERSYAPEETKRLLLDAALGLFAERGFSQTSTKDVAERAGVTKGAFYYHFATKEQVLGIIHDQFIDRALGAQEDALARFETPTEQLFHMAFDTTMVCIEYQQHVQVFFREQHLLTGEVRDAIMEKRHRSTTLFQDTVRRGVEADEFDAYIDPEVGALGLLGMWVWTYQWYRPGRYPKPREIAQQYASMTLRSVGAKQPPTLLPAD
jgi:AcrR family transcriptional regulator